MKKSIIFLLIGLTCLNIGIFSKNINKMKTTKEKLVLINFDNRARVNSLDRQIGVFDGNPEDSEAYCRMGFAKDLDLNKEGYVMKLSYDVDSTKPAFNGFWTKLNEADLSEYKAIKIIIKGDTEKGFSDFFKIELKDKNKKIECIVENISDQWKTIIIPFDEFDGDIEDLDWQKINELVIVFEDWRFKIKRGMYYIDEIAFL